jgi:Protein of unknown function (DUF1360)
LQFYWLLLGVLAAWRITYLLNAEDGPWDLVVKLRRLAGAGVLGALLDCFYCLSLWVAAPLAYFIGDDWKHRLFLWLAISAGAILLQKAISRDRGGPPAQYYEDAERNE